MKYRIYTIAILLLNSEALANNISGKSFFSDFTNYSLYSTIGDRLVIDQHHNEGHVINKKQLQATVFGGRSQDKDGLREYFLFENKKSLVVRENFPTTAASELLQDILFW